MTLKVVILLTSILREYPVIASFVGENVNKINGHTGSIWHKGTVIHMTSECIWPIQSPIFLIPISSGIGKVSGFSARNLTASLLLMRKSKMIAHFTTSILFQYLAATLYSITALSWVSNYTLNALVTCSIFQAVRINMVGPCGSKKT